MNVEVKSCEVVDLRFQDDADYREIIFKEPFDVDVCVDVAVECNNEEYVVAADLQLLEDSYSKRVSYHLSSFEAEELAEHIIDEYVIDNEEDREEIMRFLNTRDCARVLNSELIELSEDCENREEIVDAIESVYSEIRYHVNNELDTKSIVKREAFEQFERAFNRSAICLAVDDDIFEDDFEFSNDFIHDTVYKFADTYKELFDVEHIDNDVLTRAAVDFYKEYFDLVDESEDKYLDALISELSKHAENEQESYHLLSEEVDKFKKSQSQPLQMSM